MNILVARSNREIENAFGLLSRSEHIGCDTETSGLDPKRDRLLSVQFSDGDVNVLVPVSEGADLGSFSDILADRAITKIFHNSRFDLGFLAAGGFTAENVYDTMIAERVLTKGANQSVSLAETLYRYFAVDLDKSQRNKFGRNWDGKWTEDLVRYAMNDVIYLPKLMIEQRAWLKKLGLAEDFRSEMKKVLDSFPTNDDKPGALP